MQLDGPIEQLLERIHILDRAGCVAMLRTIRRPRLDFTDEYLNRLSLEQLRHVLVAACLQARKPSSRRTA